MKTLVRLRILVYVISGEVMYLNKDIKIKTRSIFAPIQKEKQLALISDRLLVTVAETQLTHCW